MAVDPIDEARANWAAAGRGATALAMANVATIMRVQQILLAQISRVLRPYGLTHARLEVMMVVLAGPDNGVPLGRIGAQVQVYPGAVTKSIDRLVADGMVCRVPHPTDGRVSLAQITSHGRVVAQNAIDDLNDQVLTGFEPSGEAGEQLFELLRCIRVTAGDLRNVHSGSAA